MRDSLIDELTRLDGVKDQKDCADCGGSFDKDKNQLFRCGDCLDAVYRCKDCILVSHADKPLHRIYVSPIIFYCYMGHSNETSSGLEGILGQGGPL